MTAAFLIVHIVIAVALIFIIVVMQRSEGGGLGIGGGGGGGMGSFMTGRSTANFFTRTTAILAALFMASSLVLTILENQGSTSDSNLVDQLRNVGTPGTSGEGSAPAPEGATPGPAAPKVE